MKTLLLICLALCLTVSFGQSKYALDNDTIFAFSAIDNLPTIEGCAENSSSEEHLACFSQAVINYIVHNFKYPKRARQMNIQAKIFLIFIVEKDASVSNVFVQNGAESKYKNDERLVEFAKELDDEARRVVASIPFLTPAKKNGRPVRIRYIVPINAMLK